MDAPQLAITFTLPCGTPGGYQEVTAQFRGYLSGAIPASGRSPGEENGNHSSILTWKISWTEEPGVLQTMRVSKSQTQLNTHAQTHTHTHAQTFT